MATAIGTRVTLVKDVDNYPDVYVEAGNTGTLKRIDSEGSYWITLDKHFPDLDEWKNAVQIWDYSPDNGGQFHPETYFKLLDQ